MKRFAFYTVISCLAFCVQANGQIARISTPVSTGPAQEAQLAENYGKLPLSFEANTGQADKGVKFAARGNGYRLFLMDEEAALALDKGGCNGLRATGGGKTSPPVRRSEPSCSHQTTVVRMRLEGSKKAVAPTGEEQLRLPRMRSRIRLCAFACLLI